MADAFERDAEATGGSRTPLPSLPGTTHTRWPASGVTRLLCRISWAIPLSTCTWRCIALAIQRIQCPQGVLNLYGSCPERSSWSLLGLLKRRMKEWSRRRTKAHKQRKSVSDVLLLFAVQQRVPNRTFQAGRPHERSASTTVCQVRCFLALFGRASILAAGWTRLPINVSPQGVCRGIGSAVESSEGLSFSGRRCCAWFDLSHASPGTSPGTPYSPSRRQCKPDSARQARVPC